MKAIEELLALVEDDTGVTFGHIRRARAELEALKAVEARCLKEIATEKKYGVHGGGSGPSLGRELMKIMED